MEGCAGTQTICFLWDYQQNLQQGHAVFPNSAQAISQTQILFYFAKLRFKGHLVCAKKFTFAIIFFYQFYYFPNVPVRDSSVTKANVSGCEFSIN